MALVVMVIWVGWALGGVGSVMLSRVSLRNLRASWSRAGFDLIIWISVCRSTGAVSVGGEGCR